MASLSITVLLINCRRDRIGDQKSGFEPENALRGTLRGRPKGPRGTALAEGKGPASFSTPQARKDHGAQRSGPRLWKRSFCASRQDRNGTVSCRGSSLAKAGVFGFAQPNGNHASFADPCLASAILVVAATAAFSPSPVHQGIAVRSPLPVRLRRS